MSSNTPKPFDPGQPFGTMRGDPVHAYMQNGWYYDGHYRPVLPVPVSPPIPPERRAVEKRRREMREPPTPKHLNLADDIETSLELRRRRLEDRRARAAEELAE